MDITELEREFLDEAFQMLDLLEKSLLTLENEPDDVEAINEAFRAAHTIKGGAATLGYDEIERLTHKVEDVLDLVRSGKLKVSPDLTDLLLKSVDIMSSQLNYRSEGRVYESDEIDDIIKGLVQISSGGGSLSSEESTKEKCAPDEFKLTEYDKFIVDQELADGHLVYLVKVKYNEDNPMKTVSPFQTYSFLRDVGEVLKVVPTLEELEKEFCSTVYFLVATDISTDELKSKVFLEDSTDSVEVKPITAASSSLGTGMESEEKVEEVHNREERLTSTEEVKTPASEDKESVIDEDKVKKTKSVNMLRVESSKIDSALNLVGELVITKANFQQMDIQVGNLISEISSQYDSVRRRMRDELISIFGDMINDISIRKRMNQFIRSFEEVLISSVGKIRSVQDKFRGAVQNLSRISSSLQESIMNMRMIPIDHVFKRLPRLVRDLMRSLNKKVHLEIHGGDTELDKSVIEDIVDPLIHLVRNAIDHGIEPPEERRAQGKPEEGLLIVEATHEGNMIIIRVKDDGRGIDIDKVLEKAIEKGLAERDREYTREQILSFIFEPGFSTSSEVSVVSGRGVGMDIVKSSVEKLGGSIEINTEKGKGTEIIIKLPLTLAILSALLVLVHSGVYAIPVSSVAEIIVIEGDELKNIEGRKYIRVREEILAVVDLLEVFEHRKRKEQDVYYIAIVSYSGKKVGLLVDELMGEQDIVIKPLNSHIIKSPGIVAATILGDGSVGFILDVGPLIESAIVPEEVVEELMTFEEVSD